MSSLIIVISLTWIVLTLRYSIGLLWLPDSLGVPACRVQLVSSVTVVFFPISEASGLHLVHHTWAGTFVLAALCLVFPGLHTVLLDSDCVPVTLFEVEDLWQEAQRLQHCGFSGPVPSSSWAGGLNSDQQDQPTLPKFKEQGVILVTEHNAEVSAGFAVLRGSNHAPPLLEEDWQSIPLGLASPRTLLFASTSRSWFLSIGSWSPQWSRMGGMTGT